MLTLPQAVAPNTTYTFLSIPGEAVQGNIMPLALDFTDGAHVYDLSNPGQGINIEFTTDAAGNFTTWSFNLDTPIDGIPSRPGINFRKLPDPFESVPRTLPTGRRRAGTQPPTRKTPQHGRSRRPRSPPAGFFSWWRGFQSFWRRSFGC